MAFEIAIQCAGEYRTYNTDNKKPRQMSSVKKKPEMTHPLRRDGRNRHMCGEGLDGIKSWC